MDKKEFTIPVFDPRALESNLYRARGEVFQPHIHDFSMIFHINRIEDFLQMIGIPTEEDRHPYRLTVFQFMFLTAGRCIRSKGLRRYEFGSDTFFIVPPYEITSMEFISDDARGFFCYFLPDLLLVDHVPIDLISDLPFQNFNSNPAIPVSGDTVDLLVTLLTRLETEYKKGKKCRQEVLRAYLQALSAELTPFVPKNTAPSADEDYYIADQFRKALAQHIYEYRKTGDYARLLRIPIRRLNQCVKNISGKGANELIQDMILLESKVLLKQTSLSISEITYKLGQNHISNFVRFFKAKTGMSPGEYRNSLKKETV
jgi:AraC family transcriptional regulator, transcriptional activator of pobA